LDYELNDEIREQLAYHPDNPNKPYDMHTVIAGIIDETHFEVHKNYAENI
jgi:propionyl-CoA carboxylase beta chain